MYTFQSIDIFYDYNIHNILLHVYCIRLKHKKVKTTSTYIFQLPQ